MTGSRKAISQLDHVHVMASLQPKYAVAQVIGFMKGRGRSTWPVYRGKEAELLSNNATYAEVLRETFGPRVIGLHISRNGDGMNPERRPVKEGAMLVNTIGRIYLIGLFHSELSNPIRSASWTAQRTGALMNNSWASTRLSLENQMARKLKLVGCCVSD